MIHQILFIILHIKSYSLYDTSNLIHHMIHQILFIIWYIKSYSLYDTSNLIHYKIHQILFIIWYIKSYSSYDTSNLIHYKIHQILFIIWYIKSYHLIHQILSYDTSNLIIWYIKSYHMIHQILSYDTSNFIYQIRKKTKFNIQFASTKKSKDFQAQRAGLHLQWKSLYLCNWQQRNKEGHWRCLNVCDYCLVGFFVKEKLITKK